MQTLLPQAHAVPPGIELVHQDQDLLVLNKPSGLLTHPVQGSDELSVVHGLLHHTKGKLAPAGGGSGAQVSLDLQVINQTGTPVAAAAAPTAASTRRKP